MNYGKMPPIFMKFKTTIFEFRDYLKKLGLPPEEAFPRIVVHADYNSVRKETEKVRSFDHVDLYSMFWIELNSPSTRRAFYCIFNEADFGLSIAVVDQDGAAIDHFTHPADDAGFRSSKTDLSHSRLMIFNTVMATMGLMTIHREGQKTSVFTFSRNKASVFYCEGDVTKFKRIFDLKKLPSPEYMRPEPGSSGIRKKEHDVIGHYRTYKSGVKVFVRPHKRGDPSLGTVTSVFT